MISNLSITLFFILISSHLKNGFILSSLFKFVGKEGISEEINFLTLIIHLQAVYYLYQPQAQILN